MKGTYKTLLIAGPLCVLLVACLWVWLNPNAQFLSGNSKTNCVYPDDSLAALAKLEAAAGSTFNCVLLYNTTNPTWADSTNVWWARPPSPDTDWLAWKRAVPGRRIIITQSMVPDDAPSNWRACSAPPASTTVRDAAGDQSCPRRPGRLGDPIGCGGERHWKRQR